MTTLIDNSIKTDLEISGQKIANLTIDDLQQVSDYVNKLILGLTSVHMSVSGKQVSTAGTRPVRELDSGSTTTDYMLKALTIAGDGASVEEVRNLTLQEGWVPSSTNDAKIKASFYAALYKARKYVRSDRGKLFIMPEGRERVASAAKKTE